MTRTCRCGARFEVKPGPGRPRVWCTPRCRKRHHERDHDQYAKRCACGARRRRQSRQCRGCWQATLDVRRTLAEGMWADGWLEREISDALGVADFNAAERRQYGYSLPYRHRVRSR